MKNSNCKHCTIVPQRIGSELRKCELNKVDKPSKDFLDSIQAVLNGKYRTAIPNGECPFSFEEENGCPYYQPD